MWTAIALIGVAACGGSDGGADVEAEDGRRVRAGCVPDCDGACGVDDGCGGTCGCPLGTLCGDDNRCVPDPCGACAPHEVCDGGECVCAPDCDDRACEPDGCGGFCECPDGYVQNADGDWVPAGECVDTCVASGWICGELCGYDCGGCADGRRCDDGWCVCEPRCDGTRCDDGCGGACACPGEMVCDLDGYCTQPASCEQSCASEGAACGEVCGEWCGDCPEGQSCRAGRCEAAISCTDCPLSMRVIDRTVDGGLITSIDVAVDFAPGEMELPRLLDLQFTATRGAELVALVRGQALELAGKSFVIDEATALPWVVHEDGTFQVLALQAGNVEEVGAGRLLTLRLSVNDPGPIEISLVRREQTFAPPASDAALQASGYDTPLVVTR